jgi:hypothetical protein
MLQADNECSYMNNYVFRSHLPNAFRPTVGNWGLTPALVVYIKVIRCFSHYDIKQV